MTAPAMVQAMVQAGERAAVERRCVNLVASTLRLCRGEVSLDDHFAQDLNADSLDMVTLSMAAEDEFGVMISDDAAAACECVRDMADVVCAAMAERDRP